MTRKAQDTCANAEGYAQHFECRPENDLFGGIIPEVIDATTIREHAVADLKVFKISDVFAGKDEIFIGFGRPNAYLVCPDGKGGYQKFAGKSLKRAPSVIEATRDFAQSGLLIRLKGLPPEAADRLRVSMRKFHGIKYWTCVNACMTVMQDAGFTSGKRPLTDRYWPYHLFTSLVNDGLSYEGKPVAYEVIRTTSDRVERYALRIIGAEVTTLCRHTQRNMEAKAKSGSRLSKIGLGVFGLPARLVGGGGKKKGSRKSAPPVAPALPENVEYTRNILMSVSSASHVGAVMRLFWGAHNLFEGTQNRVNIADYLKTPLKEFPQPNPNLATRLKKALLFSRPVIWGMRKILVPRYVMLPGLRSENDVYKALRTHSQAEPNKYNLVIVSQDPATGLDTSTFILSRISGGAKLMDWILSKHVLMSGYAKWVVFAGEIWKDENGVIHVNRNSGTYQPSAEQLDAVVEFFRALFPHLTVVKDDVL
ncbi:MAG: hypothetical protein IT343_02450 [Candidatus Melainabacteria bacterium]|jgi:hypothetical protein|nr:hypothetical protein [Candidatus Melainabacteria bacterium]